MADPVLSICVPSHNRQIYFQETIKSLLASPRSDVEFVFADNSDDPSVMNGFMSAFPGDRRIVYLPSAPKTLSMMENWERSVQAATGRFVAFIGDDDYLDPALAALLVNLEQHGEVDAVAWTGLNYFWPDGDNAPANTIQVPLGTEIRFLDKKELMRRAFHWERASHVPLSGYSIYHGALSRRLIDKLKAMGNGRVFEFPVVDWEIAFKSLLIAKTFVHSARPFSVLGACPLSNSRGIGDVEKEKANEAAFFRQVGSNFNDEDWIGQTPFRTWHGLTACIFVTQLWVARRFGISLSGYEENLVEAMARNMAIYRNRQDFDIASDRIRQALREWKNGAYSDRFNPVFAEPAAPDQSAQPRYSGIDGSNRLNVADNIAGVKTPGALFQLLEGLLERAENLDLAQRQAA